MLDAHEPDPPKPRSTGIASLVGGACILAVAADLGLPFLQQPVAMTTLLTISGYCLARAVHRSASSDSWRVPLVLGLAGRAIPAVLLVVSLTGLYEIATGGGLTTSESAALVAAVTFTSNIVPFITDAAFTPVEHFWAIALVAQAALVAPWLLTAAAHRIDRRSRSLIMLSFAASLSLIRMVMTATNDATMWSAPFNHTTSGLVAVWTMLDGLLVGLAVGTMPLASLHRHPTTKIVAPSMAILAALVTVPAFGGPLVTVGLRVSFAALFTGAILAAAAIFTLPAPVSRLLSNRWTHRIGLRSFGLYLWHIPFAYAVAGDNPFRWNGSLVFVIALLLALAAATTTYRSIELPAQATWQWLVQRWFPSEVIVLDAPPPQRDKWRRWDEISLDNLPRPVRRRNLPASAGRLWRHGERAVDEVGSDAGQLAASAEPPSSG